MSILGFRLDFWTLWGFAAQGFYFARFVIQWLKSEKEGKIVVPHSFWILSLCGSVMTLTYSLARKDLVFLVTAILQFGMFGRNLALSNKSQINKSSIAQEKQGLFSPFLRKKRYQIASRYIKNGESVLDIGCGSGGLKKHINKSIKYMGIDQKKFWNAKKKNLFVVQIGNKYPKEITKNKYSTITALAIIEHLKDPEKLFKDARKLLKENGQLIITTPHPMGRWFHDTGAKLGLFSHDASEEHEMFFDKNMLKKIGKENGFKLKNFKKFLLGFNQIFVFIV